MLVPAAEHGVVVRVYTGIFSNAPAAFNATLKDHTSGAVLAAAGYTYTSALGRGVVNQVFAVRVAPVQGGTEARTLHVRWSGGGRGGGNIEYQGVAVGVEGAAAPAAVAASAKPKPKPASAPFVILQAASLQTS